MSSLCFDLIDQLTTVPALKYPPQTTSVKVCKKIFVDKCSEARQNPKFSNLIPGRFFLKGECSIVDYVELLVDSIGKFKKEIGAGDDSYNDKISMKNFCRLMKALDFLTALTLRPFLGESLFFFNRKESTIIINEYLARTVSPHETELSILFADCMNDLLDWPLMSGKIMSRYQTFIVARCVDVLSHNKDTILTTKYKNLCKIFVENAYQPFLMRDLIDLIKFNWNRPFCSHILSHLLLYRDDGLISLLLCCIDVKVSFENYEFGSCFVDLVCKPPRTVVVEGDYYDMICKSVNKSYRYFLFDLKQQENVASKVRNFFVLVCRKLYNLSERNFDRIILKENYEPLARCLYGMKNCLPDADRLTKSIVSLDYLFAKTKLNYEDEVLGEYLTLFMQIYEDVQNSASFVKSHLKQLISICLESCPKDRIVGSIIDFLACDRKLHYKVADDGGISVENETCDKSHVENWLIDQAYFDKRLDFLSISIQNLKEPCRIQGWSKVMFIAMKRFANYGEELAKMEKETEVDENLLKNETFVRFLAVQSFLDILMFGECYPYLSCELKVEMLDFCISLLEMCDKFRSKIWITVKGSLMQSGLLIASCILPQIKKEEVNANSIRRVSEILQNLKNSDDENVKQLVGLTLSMLQLDLSDDSPQSPLKTMNKITTSTVENSAAQSKSEYEEALLDLNCSEIPVLSHGIIMMTRLILKKDPVALENLATLTEKFFEIICHDDTYVFMPALNAISVIGEIETDRILALLLGKYDEMRFSLNETENLLKIGEVATKISRHLGDLGPLYGPKILNLFLKVLKLSKGDETIRASVLSNLSEICKVMSFKLSDVLHELFYMISNIFECSDDQPLVKRACIHFLRNILCVDEKAEIMLQILQVEIKNIYRMLKKVYNEDDDHINRLHAQLCLEILNEKMKEPLLKVPELSHKITFRMPK